MAKSRKASKSHKTSKAKKRPGKPNVTIDDMVELIESLKVRAHDPDVSDRERNSASLMLLKAGGAFKNTLIFETPSRQAQLDEKQREEAWVLLLIRNKILSGRFPLDLLELSPSEEAALKRLIQKEHPAAPGGNGDDHPPESGPLSPELQQRLG